MLILFCITNAVGFIVWGYDKLMAMANRRRVRETTLMFLMMVGGVGCIAGMFIFQHKFRKAQFQFMAALVILVYTAILVYWRIR